MEYLRSMHAKFIQDLLVSTRLDANIATMIPSIIFLSSMFTLLYTQLHRHLTPFTSWKTLFYKEVIFHWSFFYATRLWFLLLKFAKWVIAACDEAVELHYPKNDIYLRRIVSHICVFVFVLCFSTLPLIIVCLQQMHRRNIPNFLIWVAEDPWIRSEIGTSGHYLERPPNAVPHHNSKHNAYRSKRSTSVDTDIYLSRESSYFRPCKSMMAVNVVKSVNELL